MSYPSLTVNRKKLIHNTIHILDLCRQNGIEPHIVTKCFCAYEPMIKAMTEAGVKNFADSRTQNLKKLQGFGESKMMLRLPMVSEADEVVAYSDISLNSDYLTLRALSEAAVRKGKRHGIILMTEIGDLREGVLPEDLPNLAKKVLSLKGLRLMGIGTNLNCYGGVIPDEENMNRLVRAADDVEKLCDIRLRFISGGNSGALHLIQGTRRLPKAINHLRIGEALLLGRETSFGREIPGMYSDVFTLRTQVVECLWKPSAPTGNIGKNAFGQVPVFRDDGLIKRAIVACGRQDTICDSLSPNIGSIRFVGASSDHMILDVSGCGDGIKTGSILDFSLSYGALLAAFTSEYIEKAMV